ACLECAIDLSKGELRTAAGIRCIHATPICVVESVKGICSKLKMNFLGKRKCFRQGKIDPVLSGSPHCSEAGISANIHCRHRELRGIELTGEGLVAMAQIRVTRNK